MSLKSNLHGVRFTGATEVTIHHLMFCVTGAAEHSQDVSHEHSIYRDIVQENFIDSYVNSRSKPSWRFAGHERFVAMPSTFSLQTTTSLLTYLNSYPTWRRSNLKVILIRSVCVICTLAACWQILTAVIHCYKT